MIGEELLPNGVTHFLCCLYGRGVYSSAIPIVSRWEAFQTGKIREALEKRREKTGGEGINREEKRGK